MSLEVVSQQQQLRAVSHPLRLRILSLLTGAAMSTAELARELELSHAAVSFHVRQLVQAGYLELAETRSVRGGKERRYRYRRPGSKEGWRAEDPMLSVRAAAAELERRLAAGQTRWRLFGDAELWVEPQVWEDIVSRIGAAVNELHDAAMAPHAPGTVHVNATAMLFSVEDGTQATDSNEHGRR
jgi:DNA-binding transcriptional ArsR family regulator